MVLIITGAFHVLADVLQCNLFREIYIINNQNFYKFEGKDKAIKETPDTALQISDTLGNFTRSFLFLVSIFIIYKILVKVVQTWLEGNHVIFCYNCKNERECILSISNDKPSR